MTDDVAAPTAEEHWDTRYGERDRVWSGKPNAVLVREAAGLPAGRALDLGCGEGADAIWLAEQGWQVTAADVSRIALQRGAEQAERAGVADRIDWQRHNLAESFPAGSFDLVSAQFLHSEVGLPREQVLRAAAAAVAPGGVLLIAGHSGPPSWHEGAARVHFPTRQEVLDSLALPQGWEVLVSEEYQREATGPDGQSGTRTDNVIKLRRTAG